MKLSMALGSSNNLGQGLKDSIEIRRHEKEYEGNPGLADALAKVIRMSKKRRGKSIILSKAKLYCPDNITRKKSYDFEIDSGENVKSKCEKEEEEEEVKPSNVLIRNKKFRKQTSKKHERLHRGRLKPSALDREKEKPLVKIATKGVVQLFNAVRQQQNKIKSEINKPGVTEGKKEKILKSIEKSTFLEIFKGKHKLISNSNELDDLNDIKEEPKNEEPSWQVLRDNFMMGAKLKDWDKNEDEINE